MNNEMCTKLICHSLINIYGLQSCNCDLIGSFDKPCNPYGGQCECRTNVHNRKCEKCLPKTWGFTIEQNGCQTCNCDPIGAKNNYCDHITGQCTCHIGYHGKKCNQCVTGFYNFPHCKKCDCNGFSNNCTPDGVCINCQQNTDGFHCERYLII